MMWHVTNLTTTHRFEQDPARFVPKNGPEAEVWTAKFSFFLRFVCFLSHFLIIVSFFSFNELKMCGCMHFIFWVKFSNFITTNIRFFLKGFYWFLFLNWYVYDTLLHRDESMAYTWACFLWANSSYLLLVSSIKNKLIKTLTSCCCLHGDG